MPRIAIFLLLAFPGTSFAQLREIPLPFPDSTRFAVQFADALHGWVSSLNGNILRTENGGASWTASVSPYSKPRIDFIKFWSKEYGVLWAENSSNDFDGRLFHTFDGGAHWSLIPTPDSINIWHEGGLGYYANLYAITILSPNALVLNGGHEWRLGGGPMNGELLFFLTTNGGVTWRTLVAGYTPANPVIQLTGTSYGLGRAALDIPDIMPVSAFYKSMDTCRTWQIVKRWYDYPATTFQFFDERVGAVYSSRPDSNVYVTYDAGESWERWRYSGGSYFTGAMVRDSVLYAIRYSVWQEIPVGTLLRTTRHPLKKPTRIYDDVRSVTSAGDKVYFLTAEGRLFEYDEALVGVEAPPAIAAQNTILISPNPVRDVLTLFRKGDSASEIHFWIYNSAGVEMLEHSAMVLRCVERSKTVSVASLPAGAYFLAAEEQGKTERQRFTVVR